MMVRLGLLARQGIHERTGSSDWDLYKILDLSSVLDCGLEPLCVVAIFWPHAVDPSTVVVVYQHQGVVLVCMAVQNPDAKSLYAEFGTFMKARTSLGNSLMAKCELEFLD